MALKYDFSGCDVVCLSCIIWSILNTLALGSIINNLLIKHVSHFKNVILYCTIWLYTTHKNIYWQGYRNQAS